jgi:hypothetical protein
VTVENGEPTIIRLAQIKQWLIPADSESYKVLADVGIPLTIFHEDFLPTIKLVTDQHNIRGIGVNFKDEILDPFLSKVGTTWQKKAESATATIKSKDMVFEVSMKDPQFSKARASIDRMRDVLYDFFCRWGYRAVFDYSEVRNKAVLRVDYVHDPARQPIVGLNEKPESDSEKVQIALGGLRLTFKFDKREQDICRVVHDLGRELAFLVARHLQNLARIHQTRIFRAANCYQNTSANAKLLDKRCFNFLRHLLLSVTDKAKYLDRESGTSRFATRIEL